MDNQSVTRTTITAALITEALWVDGNVTLQVGPRKIILGTTAWLALSEMTQPLVAAINSDAYEDFITHEAMECVEAVEHDLDHAAETRKELKHSLNFTGMVFSNIFEEAFVLQGNFEQLQKQDPEVIWPEDVFLQFDASNPLADSNTAEPLDENPEKTSLDDSEPLAASFVREVVSAYDSDSEDNSSEAELARHIDDHVGGELFIRQLKELLE